jgi:hypothetical protein
MSVFPPDTLDVPPPPAPAPAATAAAFDARATYPWVPDRGDGTYGNPVLYADYSDPDVIRDGGPVQTERAGEGGPRIDPGSAANLLLQKFPARSFVARTRVELHGAGGAERAGLIVTGREHAALAVRHDGARNEILAIVNGHEEVVAVAKAGPVDLRVEVGDGGECTFGYAAGGGPWRPAGIRFRAREGVWIGAKVGLFNVSAGATHAPGGHADFEYFRFAPAATDDRAFAGGKPASSGEPT